MRKRGMPIRSHSANGGGLNAARQKSRYLGSASSISCDEESGGRQQPSGSVAPGAMVVRVHTAQSDPTCIALSIISPPSTQNGETVV
eukprot:scaffold174109_cov30-Tisochrysis_lutea.AAC.4